MSRSNAKNRSHSRSRSPSPCSSSSSSSDSYEETEIKIIEKCKTHKKRDKSDSDKSDSECKKSKNKKHNRHEKEKHERHEKEKHDRHEKSDDEDDKKCFEDVYKYFKYRLLNDECLMVSGSQCYGNMVNNTNAVIPVTYAAEYSNLLVNKNIDYSYIGAPVFVREAGVYIIFFVGLNDQAAQFTAFVNGIPRLETTVGSNAGGGQIVSRHMLELEENDHVIIRNYVSTMSSLTCNANAGGLAVGNDLTFLLMKIAPLSQPEYEYDDFSLYEKCLSRNKRQLFKKLLDKMLCDKDLMLKGFNVRGTFYTKLTQTVLTEGDVQFDNINNANGLLWNPTGNNPEQIKVTEDGVYKVFGLIGTVISSQFALAVNGVVYDGSTQGMNHGAGQLTLRALLDLKKNDVITLRNHTSAGPSVILSQNQGGLELSVSAILTIFKISPSNKQSWKSCDVECSEYYKNCYDKFRSYLLCHDKLQIAGSPSYFSYTSTSHQIIPVNKPFYWNNTFVENDVSHMPGKQTITIEYSGIYDLFVDITTNEPSQLAIVVNDVVDTSTIFGKDTGGTKCLIRQFVKLNRGDVLTVVNNASGAGSIATAVNPGGSMVGQTALFMAFLLSPICEHDKVICGQEHKKK